MATSFDIIYEVATKLLIGQRNLVNEVKIVIHFDSRLLEESGAVTVGFSGFLELCKGTFSDNSW
jgi:hypothetical protein